MDYPRTYDLQMEMHADRHLWPEWGGAVRGDMIRPHWAHPGEDMGKVVGLDPATGRSQAYTIIRCAWCILTHAWPLASPEALGTYYQEKFYQETKPHYLEEYSEDAAWWMATHRTVFDAAQPWLTYGHIAMLDIGAGPGYPLQVGMERGYDTTALEPSPVSAEWLRKQGHEVFEMTLGDFHANSDNHGYFDLVYAWECLEHSPEPENFVLQCYDLLRPGGVMVCAVPNDFTPGQFAAQAKFQLEPWWISLPDHQWYATPKTVQLLFRRCGLQQRFMRMTFPMVEKFMLEQERCYVGNPTLGRACHRERVAFEMEMIQRGQWKHLEATYVANVEQRIGREIIGIFTKER